MVTQLLLASSSRYRAELLGRLGLGFRAVSPNVDEAPRPAEAPEALALRLARAKAAAVARGHPGAVIIGSDQVASFGSRTLGKPGTAARAREQLAMLSGGDVDFLTGLCLIDAQGREQATVVPPRVRFRELSAAEIEDYVAREQPLDCAGAFKSEALGIALFEAVESTDPTALIGLPLIELCSMLARAGVPVLAGGLLQAPRA